MTVQTTSNLSNSLRTQYTARYLMSYMNHRIYDQIAKPVADLSMDEAARGSSVQFEFLSRMAPGTTAISETTDVAPQVLVDATGSVTPTSRGEALQWSEKLDIQVFTDYAAARMERIGQNAAESVDLLALDAATQGTWVERAAARASLDAGTSSHRLSDSIFRRQHAKMLALGVPGFVGMDGTAMTWVAIMPPEVFHDLSESGRIDSVALYQNASIVLNYELGMVGPFRLVVHPRAKAFYGAGADNATAVADTLASANAALATTLTTTGDVSASIAAGALWTIGTEETGSTNYPTNERVKVQSAVTTTLTITGGADNGGMIYAHAAGTAVRNADSVYTVVYAGPESLVKVFAPSVGEFGDIVEPHETGNLKQWRTAGWKFYGGYGRISENRLLRGEYSASFDA